MPLNCFLHGLPDPRRQQRVLLAQRRLGPEHAAKVTTPARGAIAGGLDQAALWLSTLRLLPLLVKYYAHKKQILIEYESVMVRQWHYTKHNHVSS